MPTSKRLRYAKHRRYVTKAEHELSPNPAQIWDTHTLICLNMHTRQDENIWQLSSLLYQVV